MSSSSKWLWLILASALLIRAWNLGQPNEPIFDEVHYLPPAIYFAGQSPWPGLGVWENHPIASKAFDPNFYHPPLGKLLIASGIYLFGVTPWGWRLPSLCFGMLSLLCFYLVALKLWKRREIALAALILLSFDYLHIVQSRLAMLDIFGFCFAQLAFLSALYVSEKPERKGWLFVSAFSLAASLSVKYSNLTIVLAYSLTVFFTAKAPWQKRVRTLALVGVGTFLFLSLASLGVIAKGGNYFDWFKLQWFGFQTLTGNFPSHRYGSAPSAWLFNSHPIWYYFKQTATGVRAIVGMGNPAVWLVFLPCTYLLVKFRANKKDNKPDQIAGLWFVTTFFPYFLALWGRQGFIYYMLPCVSPMCLLIARTVFLIKARVVWRYSYLGLVVIAALAFLPYLLGISTPPSYYSAIAKFVSP